MQKVLTYIEQNKDRYVQELVDYVKIPSVSADPHRAHEVRRAGEWCATRLRAMGFESVALNETGGHPIVYAQWLHAGADKPTILAYGHCDVQPEDPVEKWTSPPFAATVRNGKIYGRGVDDNKGQNLTHLFALEALMKQEGKLPVNVKVFIEGEEEVGGQATDAFVKKHRDLLACDAVAVSDTAWHAPGLPTICYALRGLMYTEIHVTGPCRDLHSGHYGGRVQNPLNAMGKIIAKLQNEDGVIQIPGYYDDVVPLSDEERREFAAIGNDDEEMKRDLKVASLWGEQGYTSYERNWGRPSLDVNGIWGGYAGKGAKTVIASEGGFKLSSRLVANQNPEKCFELLSSYLPRICPPGIRARAELVHTCLPVMMPLDSPYVQAAAVAFEKGFGKRPRFVREGASIPITATFLSALKAPSILIGYGLPEDHIHSPDESFPLEHYHKGIITNCYLYHELGRIRK